LEIIFLLWLFDFASWLFLNRRDDSNLLLQLVRRIGKGLAEIRRYISTHFLNFLKLTTFNTDGYIEALAQIGAPAVPKLKRLLKANSQDVRLQIIAALGQTKSPEALDILIQYLMYGYETEQAFAIEALVNIGESSAIPALVFVWKNKAQEHDNRKAVIQAMMKIDKAVSLPIIANMVGNYDQPYDILNPPEFIRNYVPPPSSIRHLSLEERVLRIYVKLTLISIKSLPFFRQRKENKYKDNSGLGGSRGGMRL